MIKIKLGIITDIHGNSVALREIIKDANDNKVDKFFVLGDLVNDLPFGNETMDMVRNLTDVVLKGNKEQYIIEYDDERYDWDNIQFRNTIFMYNELRRDNIDYIKTLPHCKYVEYEGVRLALAHGSLKSVEELVNEYKDKIIDSYTKDLNADALIFGHTHEKSWHKYSNGKLVLNAGCAGVSPHYSGTGEYVILEVNNGKILGIEKRLVKYNTEEVKKKILESGILSEDNVFMNLTYCAVVGRGDIRESFLREARDIMLARKGKWYRDDAKGIFKYFRLYDDDIWLSLAEKYKDNFILTQ